MVSTGAVAFIAFILGRDAGPGGTVDLSFVPAVNATCNAMASLCLVAGYVAIRRRAVQLHRAMYGDRAWPSRPCSSSATCLYHYVHGDNQLRRHRRDARGLSGHPRLAHRAVDHRRAGRADAFYFALTGQFTRHRRLNRVFLPIWLYVR